MGVAMNVFTWVAGLIRPLEAQTSREETLGKPASSALSSETFDSEARRIRATAKQRNSYIVSDSVAFARRGPNEYSQLVGQLNQGDIVSGNEEQSGWGSDKTMWLRLDLESAKKLRATWSPALEELGEGGGIQALEGNVDDTLKEGYSLWVPASCLRRWPQQQPICQWPKVVSPDGDQCVCPAPQTPDGAGGCSLPPT